MKLVKENLPLDIVGESEDRVPQHTTPSHIDLQDLSAEAIDQFDEENEREKLELMAMIDVKKKEAEKEVTRQYMSHFLLGIKVSTLRHSSQPYTNRSTCQIY